MLMWAQHFHALPRGLWGKVGPERVLSARFLLLGSGDRHSHPRIHSEGKRGRKEGLSRGKAQFSSRISGSLCTGLTYEPERKAPNEPHLLHQKPSLGMSLLSFITHVDDQQPSLLVRVFCVIKCATLTAPKRKGNISWM